MQAHSMQSKYTTQMEKLPTFYYFISKERQGFTSYKICLSLKIQPPRLYITRTHTKILYMILQKVNLFFFA